MSPLGKILIFSFLSPIFNPFGRHRLTGWNAVKSRVEQLGLQLTDDQVRA